MQLRISRPASVAALVLAANLVTPVWVQAQPVSDNGAGAISSYMMLYAFAKVCKFEIEKPIAAVLESNIAAVRAKFPMPVGTSELLISNFEKQLSGHDAETCVWGQNKFNAKISEMAAPAIAAATASGVAQTPVPSSQFPLSSFPPDPVVDAAEDKAQSAIGVYATIFSISKVCSFEIQQPVAATIIANIKLLMPKAKFTDANMNTVMENSATLIGGEREKFCSPGKEKFPAVIAGMGKAAIEAAEGSGITLTPLPDAARP